MRKQKLTRKSIVIFQFFHFECSNRNYILRYNICVSTHRKVTGRAIVFLSKRQYFEKFSFISINVNTFALNFNSITMNVLSRIKVVLVEKQVTGKWLAQKLNVSTVTTSRWCSNTSQPDLATLVKIASLLDVDVKDLIVSTKK